MIRTISLSPGTSTRTLSMPLSVPAGLSLAAAGDLGGRDAAAEERRRSFLTEEGRPGPYLRLDQQHSRLVRTVAPGEALGDGVMVGDGMVTASEVTLCVTVADCMPIYLSDRRTGVKGLLHSGWKGSGILVHALRMLEERFGSRPGDLEVVMGPCIGSCCYNVDRERAELFAALWGREAVIERNRVPYLDLRAANEAILSAMGVDAVTVVTDCTGCGGPYGSFRRDGPGRYAHMLAWI